jgi:hypothetical protein
MSPAIDLYVVRAQATTGQVFRQRTAALGCEMDALDETIFFAAAGVNFGIS